MLRERKPYVRGFKAADRFRGGFHFLPQFVSAETSVHKIALKTAFARLKSAAPGGDTFKRRIE